MESFERLCLDTIVQGNVQTFVDLFYLACRGKNGADDLATLESTRESLVAAEQARRHGDTSSVIRQYTQLGKTYEGSGDSAVSVFFIKRGLDVAKLTGDGPAQIACYRQLGQSFEAAGDLANALAFHDAHCGLAQQLGDRQEEAAACEGLTRVFTLQALAADRGGDRATALERHQLALRAARGCGSEAAEAAALYDCGRLCVELGRPQDALPFLEAHSKVVSNSSDAALSAQAPRAYAALAGALEACGDLDSAVAYLQRLVDAEGDAPEGETLAEALENLGVIQARRGGASAAIEAERCLRRAYDIRAALLRAGRGSRKRFDLVRVALGLVKGGGALHAYAALVASGDVNGLLAWRASSGGAAGAEPQAGSDGV